MATVFEKIVSKELPALIIAERKDAIAFLDRHPLVDGHTLVIPKRAAQDIFDLTKKEQEAVMSLAKDVSIVLKEKLGATGVNILHASGKSAQQSVPHFHLHVIPRFDSDNHDFWPKGSFAKENRELVLKKLIDN